MAHHDVYLLGYQGKLLHFKFPHVEHGLQVFEIVNVRVVFEEASLGVEMLLNAGDTAHSEGKVALGHIDYRTVSHEVDVASHKAAIVQLTQVV